MLFRQPFRLLKKISVVAAGTGLLLSTASAAPGDHLRAGNLTVTPSIGFGFGYRSNAFRTASDPSGSGVGTVRPSVDASLVTPDVKFNLGANYTAQKYVFLTNTAPAVRANRIAALDRFNNVMANAGMVVAPTGPVGLSLAASTRLNNNPSNIDLDSDDPYTTSFANSVSAGLDLRPGPALEITPGFGYSWTQFFVPDADADREPFNARSSYGPTLNAAWRFLPRTNLVFSSKYTVNRWETNTPSIGGATVAVNNSGLGRASIGVQGRITERLRLIARIGSGFGKFQNSTSLGAVNGLMGALQATYGVSDSHSVSAGIRKSFFASFFTNSVSVVAITGGWNGRYGDKLTSSLNLGTRFEHYDGPLTRNDMVTQLRAGLGYKINNWSHTGINAGWLQRSSPENPSVEFDDVNVGANINFVY